MHLQEWLFVEDMPRYGWFLEGHQELLFHSKVTGRLPPYIHRRRWLQSASTSSNLPSFFPCCLSALCTLFPAAFFLEAYYLPHLRLLFFKDGGRSQSKPRRSLVKRSEYFGTALKLSYQGMKRQLCSPCTYATTPGSPFYSCVPPLSM